MLTRRIVLGAAIAAAFAPATFAHSYELGALKIGHPWARATVAANGGAYLSVENTGATADKLVRVSTDIAATAELHTHIKDGEIMRMRAIQAIDLPPGQKVVLAPGGFHIMLLGLKKKLVEGERFALTLEFEKAGKIVVDIAIDKPGAGAEHQHKH
jgi:copper(I)-binding protein